MSGSVEIKPALTPEQWEYWNLGDRYLTPDAVGEEEEGEKVSAHGWVALMLAGQPFGFTREDVKELNDALGLLADEGGWEYPRLRSLAARLAALLPPEGE